MIWLIILSVLTGFLMYILFAPFYLEINTRKAYYVFRFHRVVSGRLIWEEYPKAVELNIIGFHKYIPFSSDIATRKKEEERLKEEEHKTPGKKNRRFSVSAIREVLKSFKINRFYVNISFPDMPVNGVLYPAFYWIRHYTGRDVQINFYGQNDVDIEIQNNLFRVIRAYIKSNNN